MEKVSKSNMRHEIFSKSEAAAMCMCKQKHMKRDFFPKSEVASVRMHEQKSLAMQPTYSESVTLVANYCRNTRNICARNVWRRNMCRAVFEISGKFSKSQELLYYGIMRRTLKTWASIRKNFPTVLMLAALLTSIWLPHQSQWHAQQH